MDLRELLFESLDWRVWECPLDEKEEKHTFFTDKYMLEARLLGRVFNEVFFIDTIERDQYSESHKLGIEQAKHTIISKIFFAFKPYLSDNHFAFLNPESGTLVGAHIEVLNDDEFHNLMEYRIKKRS